MDAKFEKSLKVLTSMCDNTKCLSIPYTFSLFMDLAAEHGTDIGVGADDLAKKGLFWLTAKTKIIFHSRPEMMETITAATWPEAPGRLRCNRYYALSSGTSLIAEGKTEWALINIESGRLEKTIGIYPPELEHIEDKVCDLPFRKISEDFENCSEIAKYAVRSTDIDLGQHMNNAVYANILFGAFSCKEIADLAPTEVEIIFRSPCFEGETLSIRRRDAENGLEIGMIKKDGKAAAVAFIG